MKLIRFAIHDPEGFRSLPQSFEVNFLGELDYDKATDFNPYVLAGGNGSGKSNVLEALAEIFYHLDCRYLSNKPDYFEKSEREDDDDPEEEDYDPLRYNPEGYDSTKCRIDAYALEYFIFPDAEVFGEEALVQVADHEGQSPRRALVRITKKENSAPLIEWVDRVSDSETSPELSPAECRALLPDHVVGYASGNNETLSTPFFKSRLLQYDAYLSTLENQSFVDPRPETSLVYLDEAYSQAILLTNLLMWGDPDTGEQGDQLAPFLETIGLKDINTFRLLIRLDTAAPKWVLETLEEEYRRQPESSSPPDYRLIANIDLKDDLDTINFRSYLNKLKLCATCFRMRDTLRDQVGPELEPDDDEDEQRAYLELDYKVDNATRKAFRHHFVEPVKLFELLHLLLVLNNYELDRLAKRSIYNATGKDSLYLAQRYEQLPKVADRILRIRNFTIRKQGVVESIDTRALSDGEHQFLHALGLCLLYKDKRTLFLFDEPETHFNPDWKAKFITALRSCFAKEVKDTDETMREMLITTHSPLVISDCEREYVRVFKKDKETGEVKSVQQPGFETLGASVRKIGIRLFNVPESIGNYAKTQLLGYLKQLEITEGEQELEALLTTVSDDFGESIERQLLLHRIMKKIEEA